MHGLQTLQKLNDAQIALRNAQAQTTVADVVDGYFVFLPHGYQVVYHTADKLPTEDRPFLTIDFKGDDGHGPRFDILPKEGPTAVNRTLDDTVALAASAGLDAKEVAGRLGRLYADVNRN